MKSPVTNVEEISSLIMPEGTYKGVWSGYQVTVAEKWKLTTKVGIRGTMVCTVTVDKSGSIEVST